MMREELEKSLYEKYPLIFRQKDLPSNRTNMCWGICCNDGWFNIINALCATLQHQTDQLGGPQIEAAQIKEKFGGLRFYTDGGNASTDLAISLAETLSLLTCEICGAPGQLHKRGGWVQTLCDQHAEEDEWTPYK
jgi:hypothetical protein